jgi:hypothetical protein
LEREAEKIRLTLPRSSAERERGSVGIHRKQQGLTPYGRRGAVAAIAAGFVRWAEQRGLTDGQWTGELNDVRSVTFQRTFQPRSKNFDADELRSTF